jgi:hypothetical protein
MSRWQVIDNPPKNLAKIPAGGVGLGSDGNWYHVGKSGKVYIHPGTGAVKPRVGAGYTPINGNYVVDAGTADDLVKKNGGWTTPVPAGSWPQSMTDEAVRYLATSPSEDIYIWCGENQKIYQIDDHGDLTAVGDPGASFDPTAPPGVTCKDPQVWDPIVGKCVTPSAPAPQTFWGQLPLWAKIGGGVVLAGGLAYGGYKLMGKGGRHARRNPLVRWLHS